MEYISISFRSIRKFMQQISIHKDQKGNKEDKPKPAILFLSQTLFLFLIRSFSHFRLQFRKRNKIQFAHLFAETYTLMREELINIQKSKTEPEPIQINFFRENIIILAQHLTFISLNFLVVVCVCFCRHRYCCWAMNDEQWDHAGG